MEARISLSVNGAAHDVVVDTRTTLLDGLRDRLGIFSPKKGCDHGQCGSCTVLVDGRRIVSCLSFAVAYEGTAIVTAEGLGEGDDLHEMQQAFIDEDAFQCGYCTPGQLSSAHALLREHARGDLCASTFGGPRADVVNGPPCLSGNEIRERMAGNICRCGAYANIVAAIAAVTEGQS